MAMDSIRLECSVWPAVPFGPRGTTSPRYRRADPPARPAGGDRGGRGRCAIPGLMAGGFTARPTAGGIPSRPGRRWKSRWRRANTCGWERMSRSGGRRRFGRFEEIDKRGPKRNLVARWRLVSASAVKRLGRGPAGAFLSGAGPPQNGGAASGYRASCGAGRPGDGDSPPGGHSPR
jgi:hypothetical protein